MSSPAFTIRHATAADAPAVRAFVTGILWSYGLDADHDDLRVFGVPFNGALAELVAVDGTEAGDGAPIGMVTLWPRGVGLGWIAKLFVDPEHRGRGIGRALLAAIIDEARGWKLRAVGLSTVPRLREAVALYESMGWRRKVGTRARDRVYWKTLR